MLFRSTESEKDQVLESLGFDPHEFDGVQEEGGEESGEEPAPEEEEATPKASAKKKGKPNVQRYKGLGEMNSEELWETTLNPETRVLKQVTVEDAEEADRVFDILMGNDVPSRKSFIQSNAKMAEFEV